jgi:hypothetical protein
VIAEHDARRLERLVPEAIARMGLDLRGLRVLTEAASGPYVANAALAAAAGAEVVAIAADTRFHRAAEAAAATRAMAARLDVDVDVVTGKEAADLGSADIVTNTGAVRPVDAETVAALKPTAVVALMWETWEFLPAQIDLDACRARGVLVLGTNEHEAPCDLGPYMAALGVRLLFDLGLEAAGTRVVLLGRQATFGAQLERGLLAAGAEVECFSRAGEGGRPYDQLAGHVAAHGAGVDAVLVADHLAEAPLVGDDGPLPPAVLAAAAPAARVGVVSGGVDADALRGAGLLVLPELMAAPRTQAFSAADLGPRPVLELFAAGLRVGEVAARARLDGLEIAEAARRALRDAPAMDFPGEHAWA